MSHIPMNDVMKRCFFYADLHQKAWPIYRRYRDNSSAIQICCFQVLSENYMALKYALKLETSISYCVKCNGPEPFLVHLPYNVYD